MAKRLKSEYHKGKEFKGVHFDKEGYAPDVSDKFFAVLKDFGIARVDIPEKATQKPAETPEKPQEKGGK